MYEWQFILRLFDARTSWAFVHFSISYISAKRHVKVICYKNTAHVHLDKSCDSIRFLLRIYVLLIGFMFDVRLKP